MLKMYSTNSPARLGMKLLMNWKPPKNRKNSPDQKIALQITIIESRSLDPVRSEPEPVGPQPPSEEAERRGDLAGGAQAGGDRPRVGVIGRRPSSGRAAARRPGAVAPGELEEEVLQRPVHLDPVAELGQGPVGQHPAPVDDPDRVGQLLGDREQVGRHQDRHARPGLRHEQVLDDPRAPRVEADQGLVDDQDLGVVDQRGGEDHPLLHPVRVVLGQLVDVVAHLEGLDQLGDPPGRGPRGRARTSRRRTGGTRAR